MENKINIARLLEDCPKGMQLDCTTWENVTLHSAINDTILIMRNDKVPAYGSLVVLNKYGRVTNHPDEKCRIFPKGKTTWEGFVPPCKFKDGDVISVIVNKNLWYGIYQKEFNTILYCHVSYSNSTESLYPSNDAGMCLIDDIVEIRLATEEEKQKLFDAIKANGYKWNFETKTLEKLIKPIFKKGDKVQVKNGVSEPRTINDVYDTFYTLIPTGKLYVIDQDNWELVPNKFDINTLKPFDKVLVRDRDIEEWCISFFDHCNRLENYKYSCVNGSGYARCIPYEENKHLCGTTNDCDDFYKIW